MNILINPAASSARLIENLIICEEKATNLVSKGVCHVTSKMISTLVFPIFLALELTLKRIPKLLIACLCNDQKKIASRFEKIQKFVYSFFFSPLGLLTADAVSTFFLKKNHRADSVTPFGVENIFGATSKHIIAPKTKDELRECVQQAIKENKQISVIGAGFSQGPQTVPYQDNHLVLNLKHLNHVKISDDKTTVTCGAGANWEQVQKHVNGHKKSVIVKQASDPFSVGGSISINCHGWAHAEGTLAQTVEELEIINAEGNLETIKKDDKKFGCFFGTLGYFGVIVSAKLRLEDNTELLAQCEEIDTSDFTNNYETKIQKDASVPLFYGRLALDSVNQAPLQKVCMQKYTKTGKASQVSSFEIESKFGSRIERVFIQAIGHLNDFFAKRLLRFFWNREKSLMMSEATYTRNEILHPPINCFKKLQASNLHTQWLQEYFVTPDKLSDFIKFLGTKLQDNDVRLINASIRPLPKDSISILPYADVDRQAVVLCFHQMKTPKRVEKTRTWIREVNDWLLKNNGRYYQAYMPFATREEFEKCYGKDTIQNLRDLKQKYDPNHVFGNSHTAKYFEKE